MKQNKTRFLAASLLLSLCLTSIAACRTPSDAAPDTDGATQAGDTTAAIVTTTEAATTQPVTTPVTEPATTPATEPTTEPATEPETEVPFVGQTFDATTCIVIPADADEITRNAAAMVAETIAEVADMTLTVASESGNAPALILEIGSFDTDRSYSFSMDGQTLRLKASDSTTLYFAAEAVLETWLTPDFGLRTEGVLSLADNRVAELNGLTTRQDLSIKILTQNVRCASDPDGNSIGKRNTRLHQLLIEYRPDLIGAQEVTREWVQNFRRMDSAMEKLGADVPEYGIVTCFREGPDKIDGEAQTILYSLERFELLDSGVIWLSDTPDVPSQLEDASYNCVLTWAYLKDKLTGEKILYGNTHLEYRFAKEHIRIAQMGYILDFLEKYRDECTVYVSGDFNFKPDSAPYQMATEVLMDSHDTAWKNLSTVDYTYHDYEREPEKTRLDHIFHNDCATPVRYEIISKLYDGFVSDHYGVIVEFVN